MTLFLTSSIGGSYIDNGKRYACELDERNHFKETLKRSWPEDADILLIASDPKSTKENDAICKVMEESFRLSEFAFGKIMICDERNANNLSRFIKAYKVVILCGGHVPTQNDFFQRLHLKHLLASYKGLVIGISAGTMNCADIVYAQPEYEDEVKNSNYCRYLEGLNLTKISILPHFDVLRKSSLGGMRIVEDISLQDSYRRSFYALVDGAYIAIRNGRAMLFGEAYLFHDGRMTKVCENQQSLRLV